MFMARCHTSVWANMCVTALHGRVANTDRSAEVASPNAPGNVGRSSPRPISKRSVVRRRKTKMLNMTSRTAMPPVAHRILKSSFKLLISGNQRGKPQ